MPFTGCKNIYLGCVLVNHEFTVCTCDALHSQFTENSSKKAENSEHNAVLLSLLFTLDNLLQKCKKHLPQGGSWGENQQRMALCTYCLLAAAVWCWSWSWAWWCSPGTGRHCQSAATPPQTPAPQRSGPLPQRWPHAWRWCECYLGKRLKL